MTRIHKLKRHRLKQTLVICFLIGGAFLAVAQPRATPTPPQGRTPRGSLQGPPNDRMTRKQQKDLIKYKFDKMKEDVDELAELALSLQKEMESTTENMLSLEVVEKAKKIEKLAKKIKNSAKGY